MARVKSSQYQENQNKRNAYLRNTLDIAGIVGIQKPADIIGKKFVFYPVIAHSPFAGTITGIQWTESTLTIEVSVKYHHAPAQPITDITFATSWEDRLWRMHHYVQNDNTCLHVVPGQIVIE